MTRKDNARRMAATTASIAVLVGLVTMGVNTSASSAESLTKIPVVEGMVKVLQFRNFKIDEDSYNVDIKIPQIDGLGNKQLESALNQKYMEENKKLYENFINEMEKIGDGHLAVDSGYIVKTDNDEVLSIGRYVVNTMASSSTIFKYDTIDKKNEVLITLPSLFKDDSYIEIISKNIEEQMIERNKEDENNIYWVEGIQEENIDLFEKIAENQNFYISEEGKLVISFDKYEVAPGYMGVIEFTIPTETLSDILVSD